MLQKKQLQSGAGRVVQLGDAGELLVDSALRQFLEVAVHQRIRQGSGSTVLAGAKKGQVSFFGRPLGRVVVSRPRRTALLLVHWSSPNGKPRLTLRRTECSSASASVAPPARSVGSCRHFAADQRQRYFPSALCACSQPDYNCEFRVVLFSPIKRSTLLWKRFHL